MSPIQAGFQRSMPKAAAARAFMATYSEAEARAVCSSVHMTAARTALGGNPAAATKHHTAATTATLRSRWPRRSRGSHPSSRFTSAKTMPVWRPETASRCENPLRE